MDISSKLARLVDRFHTDSLFKNAVYLMLSTVVQAVFGFLFWLLGARLYTPGDVGLAAALISVSTFIAYVSMLGFNSTFIRFLPTSKQRNNSLNTGLLLVLGMSTVVAFGFVALVARVSPRLAFIVPHPLLAVGFVVLTAGAATNLLTDSVFIAYRASRYNLLIYSIQSLAKLFLPLAMLALGAYGMFAASGLAAALALALSLYFMARSFNYRLQLRISAPVIAEVWHFSSGSYVANLFNIIPTLVLPLIIVNRLGAADAGYFYLAFMLANLIYAVAYAVSLSLFAEGSYEEGQFRPLLLRAAKLMSVIIVPVAVVLAVLGPVVLDIFGRSYSRAAGQVIVVLALAAPAVAAYVLGGVSLRIAKKYAAMIFTNLVYLVTICGLALLWSPRGLVWIAGAWLIGNLVSACMSFSLLAMRARRKNPRAGFKVAKADRV